MSKRAEERALEFYPEKDFNKEPNYLHTCDSKTLDEVYREIFILGYKTADVFLGWHSVDESLPPMGEEVIVLTNMMNGIYLSSARRLSFGHIVNKEICTDYDGWNIPGVKYWMPCPKLPKEE